MIHDPEGVSTIDRAINVLSVQAEALSNVTRLYSTDPIARDGLLRAVEVITRSQRHGGKTIVCGVGKSGLVGNKTVATLKSLGIGASFMHASEAAHGDLGDIREVPSPGHCLQTHTLTLLSTTSSCSSLSAARLQN